VQLTGTAIKNDALEIAVALSFFVSEPRPMLEESRCIGK